MLSYFSLCGWLNLLYWMTLWNYKSEHFNGSEYTMCVSSIIGLLFKLKFSPLVSNLVYPGTLVQTWNMAAQDLLAACLTPY